LSDPGGAQPEVRIDPLNGLRVLVSASRAERPGAMPSPCPRPPLDPATDPFAEGNEQMTPPEVWADRPGGSSPNRPGWRVRSVPNLYPALDQSFAGDQPGDDIDDALGLSRGMPELLVKGPAHGAHEVIVNAPGPVQSLAELSVLELKAAMAGWAARISAHSANSAYTHVCVNERAEAGATLAHTHAQLYALPFVPPLVARERERMRAYFEHTQGRNLVEDLLIEEVRGGDRLIAIDDHAALVAPFASATPYRMSVIPRRPEPRFEESESFGFEMLHTALRAISAVFGEPPPLNLWVRTAPRDAESFCWRIEIVPRIGQPAGFEFGTGGGINSVPPETAARELRQALA
jgi:UDPglucose--hexose-1-phosphate uridylyltransferase